MKKLTSLFAALMAIVALNAATITLGSSDFDASGMTKSGITITPSKADGQTAPAINTYNDVNTLCLYANNTLTFNAGSADIIAISLKLNSSTQAKRLTTITANNGTVAVVGDPDWTATWEGTATGEIIFTIGATATLGTENTKAGQIHIMEIIVETDGEGGGDDPIVDPVEGDYSFEPTTVTTITETMDYAEYVIVADYNMIEVYMESETSIIDLWLFADNLANGIPAGTYTINSTMESNTAMASPGGDDEYDYPSYLATDFTAEGYTSAYYLTAGTVTVTKEDANTKIVVAATSYYGSTINATYEGEIEEYIEDAVENVMTNALKVRLDNGNLIVPAQAGDKVAVFNATGQILYDATAAGETTICGLQAGQVVIVRVADKATKVVL